MGTEYSLVVWASSVLPVIVRPERLLACLLRSTEEMAADFLSFSASARSDFSA
jgi:hypothetical protein